MRGFSSCGCGDSIVAVSSLSCSLACGILIPQAGIETCASPASEGRFFTTGPLGKSLRCYFVTCALHIDVKSWWLLFLLGLSWWLSGWRIRLQCRETWETCVWSPWSGKISLRGKWQPTQYSCLGNPTGRGAWRAAVQRVAELETTRDTNECAHRCFLLHGFSASGFFSAECRGSQSVWVKQRDRKIWTSHSLPVCSSDVSGAKVVGSFCTKLDKSESMALSTGCSRFLSGFLFFFFSLLPLLSYFLPLQFREFSVFLSEVFRRSWTWLEFSLLVCVKSTSNLTRVTDRGDDKNNFCFISFKPWEEHHLLDKVTSALF